MALEDSRPALGRVGEDAAASLYERWGYEIIDRNYRAGRGEIDLVVRRGVTVVFCEVKTRRHDAFGAPYEAVHNDKQRRLRRLAARWLADRRPGPVEVRFDVVSVIVRAGRVELEYIEDAF
ncbi:MAG: putative endonuclease [Actinomycetota bacterium]|jgi:putative endonuclease|nr:putative endonuclease [Actinomycetota bacterium]